MLAIVVVLAIVIARNVDKLNCSCERTCPLLSSRWCLQLLRATGHRRIDQICDSVTSSRDRVTNTIRSIGVGIGVSRSCGRAAARAVDKA